jgi:NTP pyrophosphatase (non-canonical NTP hydrolase)
MLTREQYLFVKLMEESAEVAKEASKCLLYTPHHTYPLYDKTNLEKLIEELKDQVAVLQLLEASLGVQLLDTTPDVARKSKLQTFMVASKTLGVLECAA